MSPRPALKSYSRRILYRDDGERVQILWGSWTYVYCCR
jgi:hypothetical protein